MLVHPEVITHAVTSSEWALTRLESSLPPNKQIELPPLMRLPCRHLSARKVSIWSFSWILVLEWVLALYYYRWYYSMRYQHNRKLSNLSVTFKLSLHRGHDDLFTWCVVSIRPSLISNNGVRWLCSIGLMTLSSWMHWQIPVTVCIKHEAINPVYKILVFLITVCVRLWLGPNSYLFKDDGVFW